MKFWVFKGNKIGNKKNSLGHGQGKPSLGHLKRDVNESCHMCKRVAYEIMDISAIFVSICMSVYVYIGSVCV